MAGLSREGGGRHPWLGGLHLALVLWWRALGIVRKKSVGNDSALFCLDHTLFIYLVAFTLKSFELSTKCLYKKKDRNPQA